MKLLGKYDVEVVTPPAHARGMLAECRYVLRGPRGAEYGLIRNIRRPHMLYAINLRRFGVASPGGYSWFTDKDGTLVPLN